MGCEVSALHQGALTNYCVSMATVEMATKEINRDGLTIVNAQGNMEKHPASVALGQALTQARNYMVELGLTPGSAGKIPKARKESRKLKFANL
jgi:P27 family predicted phage terminase small subunit